MLKKKKKKNLESKPPNAPVFIIASKAKSDSNFEMPDP